MFRAEAFIVKNLKKNYRTSRSVKAVTKDSADFLMQCALGEKLNSREKSTLDSFFWKHQVLLFRSSGADVTAESASSWTTCPLNGDNNRDNHTEKNTTKSITLTQSN